LGGGKSSSKPQITRRPAAPQKREGSLSSDSIFAEDEAGFKLTPSGRTPSRQKVAESDAEETQAEPLEDRMPERMQLALDPNPKARLRWERKMIIRAVRKRGRLTKEEVRLATERESSLSSHWFKTSVKKLGPLARQIAGKNIDEAIIQMRFSKKKAAKDVMEHLQHAKNVAVVRHGMGLGQMTGEESSAPEPVTVILKDGTKKVITDPASIYIAQAWVNRGPFDLAIDHRARGQANRLRLPHTGLSVILKEEKSRIREWQDREAKALRQRKSKLWVHLPDRKISAQNQYYSW
jgi:ribosomal protein L22